LRFYLTTRCVVLNIKTPLFLKHKGFFRNNANDLLREPIY
jgi:hypothetical protein